MTRQLLEKCFDLPARRRDLELDVANCNASYVARDGVLWPVALAADEWLELRASLRSRLANDLETVRAGNRGVSWSDVLVFAYPAVAVVGTFGIAGALIASLVERLAG